MLCDFTNTDAHTHRQARCNSKLNTSQPCHIPQEILGPKVVEQFTHFKTVHLQSIVSQVPFTSIVVANCFGCIYVEVLYFSVTLFAPIPNHLWWNISYKQCLLGQLYPNHPSNRYKAKLGSQWTIKFGHPSHPGWSSPSQFHLPSSPSDPVTQWPSHPSAPVCRSRATTADLSHRCHPPRVVAFTTPGGFPNGWWMADGRWQMGSFQSGRRSRIALSLEICGLMINQPLTATGAGI